MQMSINRAIILSDFVYKNYGSVNVWCWLTWKGLRVYFHIDKTYKISANHWVWRLYMSRSSVWLCSQKMNLTKISRYAALARHIRSNQSSSIVSLSRQMLAVFSKQWPQERCLGSTYSIELQKNFRKSINLKHAQPIDGQRRFELKRPLIKYDIL